MDCNIDPLLNMTFDENGIEDFLKRYELKIDNELSLLKTAGFIQAQIKQNQEILDYPDYDKIDAELEIYSKILELQKLYERLLEITKELDQKIERIVLEKEEFSLPRTELINQEFLEYLDKINSGILTGLEEINLIKGELKSSLDAFKLELFNKVSALIILKADSRFFVENRKALQFVMDKTKLPLIKPLKMNWNEEEENLKLEIQAYLTTFLDIGIMTEAFCQKSSNFSIENEKSVNFYERFFAETYAKPLREAVRFHFLQEQQTNRVDKPEWLFSFLQNSLESNLNALLELGVQHSLKFFSRTLYEIFSEEIAARFEDDFEILINDPILLLHFFDSLSDFEAYMLKFFPQSNDFPILQRLLLKRKNSLDNLLVYEKSIFDEKVFDSFKKLDFSSNVMEKISSNKKIDVFLILENYCILYKKLFKKYNFVNDKGLITEINNVYTQEVLNTLLEKMAISFNNFLNAKKDGGAGFGIMKNFWLILKNLKAFYKDQHQDRLLKEIILEIRDFKHTLVLKEVKSAISKSMKTFTNNHFRVFFKTSRILLLLTNREKVDFEDRELKKILKDMIVSPLENEINEIERICSENLMGLIEIIKKEVFSKVFEFLFQGVFANYKMNEYGSNFVENVFNRVIVLIDQKIKAKSNQVFTYNIRKLRESFILFKSDKNEIERLVKMKEDLVKIRFLLILNFLLFYSSRSKKKKQRFYVIFPLKNSLYIRKRRSLKLFKDVA